MVKSPKPRVINLPQGVKFYPVVLQVTETDESGAPRVFRLLRDDESVSIEGGEEFFVVYGPKVLSDKAPRLN